MEPSTSPRAVPSRRNDVAWTDRARRRTSAAGIYSDKDEFLTTSSSPSTLDATKRRNSNNRFQASTSTPRSPPSFAFPEPTAYGGSGLDEDIYPEDEEYATSTPMHTEQVHSNDRRSGRGSSSSRRSTPRQRELDIEEENERLAYLFTPPSPTLPQTTASNDRIRSRGDSFSTSRSTPFQSNTRTSPISSSLTSPSTATTSSRLQLGTRPSPTSRLPTSASWSSSLSSLASSGTSGPSPFSSSLHRSFSFDNDDSRRSISTSQLSSTARSRRVDDYEDEDDPILKGRESQLPGLRNLERPPSNSYVSSTSSSSSASSSLNRPMRRGYSAFGAMSPVPTSSTSTATAMQRDDEVEATVRDRRTTQTNKPVDEVSEAWEKLDFLNLVEEERKRHQPQINELQQKFSNLSKLGRAAFPPSSASSEFKFPGTTTTPSSNTTRTPIRTSTGTSTATSASQSRTPLAKTPISVSTPTSFSTPTNPTTTTTPANMNVSPLKSMEYALSLFPPPRGPPAPLLPDAMFEFAEAERRAKQMTPVVPALNPLRRRSPGGIAFVTASPSATTAKEQQRPQPRRSIGAIVRDKGKERAIEVDEEDEENDLVANDEEEEEEEGVKAMEISMAKSGREKLRQAASKWEGGNGTSASGYEGRPAGDGASGSDRSQSRRPNPGAYVNHEIEEDTHERRKRHRAERPIVVWKNGNGNGIGNGKENGTGGDSGRSQEMADERGGSNSGQYCSSEESDSSSEDSKREASNQVEDRAEDQDEDEDDEVDHENETSGNSRRIQHEKEDIDESLVMESSQVEIERRKVEVEEEESGKVGTKRGRHEFDATEPTGREADDAHTLHSLANEQRQQQQQQRGDAEHGDDGKSKRYKPTEERDEGSSSSQGADAGSVGEDDNDQLNVSTNAEEEAESDQSKEVRGEEDSDSDSDAEEEDSEEIEMEKVFEGDSRIPQPQLQQQEQQPQQPTSKGMANNVADVIEQQRGDNDTQLDGTSNEVVAEREVEKQEREKKGKEVGEPVAAQLVPIVDAEYEEERTGKDGRMIVAGHARVRAAFVHIVEDANEEQLGRKEDDEEAEKESGVEEGEGDA